MDAFSGSKPAENLSNNEFENKQINLARKGLQNLDSTLFQDKDDIEIINFSFNQLSILDSNIFHGLIYLKQLDLSNNSLESIEHSLFLKSTVLECIDLSHNNLNKIDLDAFVGLFHLKNLKLNNNKITQFSMNNLKDLFKLEDLDLSFNKLNKIDEFNGSNRKYNLKFLSLRQNKIESIDGNFKCFPKLIELKLDKNLIDNLSSEIFDKLEILECINLSHNMLKHLDKHIFKGLTRLNHIDLKDNQLKDLELTLKGCFSMDLSNNEGLEFQIEINGCIKLCFNTKYYCNEKRSTITNKTRDSLSVWLMKLDCNRLEDYFMENNISRFDEMKTVDLKYKQIQTIHERTFRHFRNISSIDLSHNCIKSLDPKLFYDLFDLRTIDLSYNELNEEIDYKIFKHLHNIEQISLNNNYFTRLDYRTFQNLHNLKQIKLHSNLFTVDEQVCLRFKLILERNVTFVSLKHESENSLLLIHHPKIGNYKLMSEVGSGKFGTVYRVESLANGET